MLNIQSEQIISLQDAAGVLPRRRGGKKPHIATLYRWSQQGCRGIVLETCQIGGTRCTSAEALQRFFDRLTARSSTSIQATTASSQAVTNKACELEREGW